MSINDEQIESNRRSKNSTFVAVLLLLLGVLTVVSLDNVYGHKNEAPTQTKALNAEEEKLLGDLENSDVALDRLHLVTRLPDVYSSDRISGTGVVGELVGDRAFWLTQPDGLRKTLVILDSESDRTQVKKGERVQISGHVFQTSGLNESSLDELSAATQAVLGKERAFIFSRRLVSLGLDQSVSSIDLVKSEATNKGEHK